MAQTKCPHCFHSIPEEVTRCPYCHGSISARRGVGTPPVRPERPASQVNLGAIVAIALAGVLLLGGAGALLLYLPQLLQTTPGPSAPVDGPPPPPADTQAGVVVPTETPAVGTPFPTPRPPQGWQEVGNVREGILFWVPDGWLVYEVNLDPPQEWIDLATRLDGRLSDFLLDEPFHTEFTNGTIHLMALDSSQQVTGTGYWPDTVAVRPREDLVGRAPEDVLKELEDNVLATYSGRGLKLKGQGVTTVRDYPVARIEYTWDTQTQTGAKITLHAVTMDVFGAQMVYEVHLETSDSRYNIVSSQTYQNVVRTLRFPSPAEEVVPEYPQGWHEVHSEANGYTLWVPDDWLAFRGDSDDYAAWKERVVTSYKRGQEYMDFIGGLVIDRFQPYFIAFEPPERKNSSLALGTIAVYPDTEHASAITREQLLQAWSGLRSRSKNQTSVQTLKATVRLQHEHATAYLEGVSDLTFNNGQSLAIHSYHLITTDGQTAYHLEMFCLEDQFRDFKSTFELVGKSFSVP